MSIRAVTYESTGGKIGLSGTTKVFLSLSQGWYGIEIDESNSSPDVTRIASDMTNHASLPVHIGIKGCLLNDDGTVNYYLKSDDWTKKVDGSASNHDGTDGQVMMEWPDFYYKVETDYPSVGKHQIKISKFTLDGFTLVPKHYISAYQTNIKRSSLTLASVINTTTDYRGGNNTSAWDANANSLLGKPASNINRTNFRTYARNRGSGWNINSYLDHKWLFWFFAIEFATLNSQKAVNTNLTVDGYKQGGLGIGVTNTVSVNWGTFNSYNPFINNGSSNSLGNTSGEFNTTIVDFGGSGVNVDFKVPRYRGHENPFGHIWNILDGINVNVESVAEGDVTETWISNNPSDWNDTNYTNYTNVGNQPRSNGYIKTTLMGVGAEFAPKMVGGGSTTYYCDYNYTSLPASGVALRMFLVGGRADTGSRAGLASATSYTAPSSAYSNIGARLSFLAT